MDLKTGGITAAAAFSLSLLIGLVSRSTMPLLIVWPFVFALVFFILFNVAKFLLNQFLPELLEDEDSGSNASLLPGSVVNIVEGDDSGFDEYSSGDTQDDGGAFLSQTVNAARPDDSEKSMGDISTLSEVVTRKTTVYKETSTGVSAGMDQNMEDGYNILGESDNFSQPAPQTAFETGASKAASGPAARTTVKSRSPAWLSASDDTLPDLDSMAGVFANASATEEEPETVDIPDSSRGSKKSSKKDKSLEGDFSPKEIAEGIRTILKKEKED